MSRILRRPMFRGGPVNSEGTGITSGLNQGYANGGRIGYEEPTADNNYNLVTPSYDEFGVNMMDLVTPAITPTSTQTGAGIETIAEKIARQRDDGIKRYNEGLKKELEKELEKGTTTNIGINPATGLPFKTISQRERLGLQPSIYDLAKKEGVDIESGTKTEQGDKLKKFEEYLKDKKNKDKEVPDLSKSNVLADAYSLFNKPQGTAKQTINEDEQFDKFYNKALKSLGGEKADRQAIFDAMLAASPAFFKGRTLREAAPNVFESITKSGAFDKPQKIKQAAAELALTRQITLEKIQEQEKARAALLSQKLMGPQTIQNDIAKIQANFKTGPNPLSITGVAPVAIKGVAISQLDKNPEASAYIDKQEKGKLILVEDPQGAQHYIAVTRKDPKTNKSVWSYVGQKGIGQTANPVSSEDSLAYSNYKAPD